MDVDLSEEQELLRSSARDFLRAECPVELVRQMMDDARGMPTDLWRKMAELGWLGLTIPEEHGGSDLGIVDLALLLEEMGRCLLPAPYFSTVAVGATAIMHAGSREQKSEWLPRIASGDCVIALAQTDSAGSWSLDEVGVSAESSGDGVVLSGTRLFVRDGMAADVLLVPVKTTNRDDDIMLLLVDADSPGVTRQAVDVMDQTRKFCDVRFDELRVDSDRVLRGARQALEHVHDLAKVGLTAEACGGAEAILDASVAYASSREQFGKPIGTFQAIQHKCADQLIHVEGLRSAMLYSAWSLDSGELDAHASACMAKAYAADTYPRVCGAGIQIHGGLGFTWEQDLHLYYKRAKTDEFWFGDGNWNRELVAQSLVDAHAS